MHTIRQVVRYFERRRSRPTAVFALALGVGLAFAWLLAVAGVSFAAPHQQDTPSPSQSPSPDLTLSPSPTLTLTATLATATATATDTLTPAPSATPPLVPSLTWTLPPAAPAPTEPFPTAALAPLEPAPTAQPTGPTPTLLPLPSLTYQYPGVTPRGDLLSLSQPTAAQVLSKGRGTFAVRLTPSRGWLLGAILLLWVGLVIWFVVAQIIARRQ